MKKNKVLIIVATHGDEPFAISMIRKLSKKYRFDWLVGNPRALKNNSRGTQADLNRSAPGNIKSKIYEERRAAYLIKLSRKYEIVLDIHSANYLDGIVSIVTNPSWQNIELAQSFPADSMIIWPSLRTDASPLTQFMPNAIEIECGRSDNPELAIKLEKLLVMYLGNPRKKFEQEKYIVTGKILGRENKKLRDFQLATVGNYTFYPFLSNQYPSITTYMLQKLGENLQ